MRATRQYIRRGPAGIGEAVSIALFVSFLLLWTRWVYLSPVITRVSGDFLGFLAAGQLALAGHAPDAYRIEPHAAAELALHQDPSWLYVAFFYPPIFLLLCAPLALLAYVPALTLWLWGSCAAYVASLRALAPDRRIWILCLGYPAVMVNAGYGQNGFLNTALLAGAALWLDRRPVLAGICLGSLAYKPQLGVIIPLALAVMGRWRCFVAASATVLGLALLTTLAFGPDVWGAFLANLANARRWMEIDDPNYLGMWITVYGAIRFHGGPLEAAYAAQAATSLATGIALLWVLHRRRDGVTGAEGIAAITASIPFCSPFLLEYDLVVLAIPMAWLLAEALRTGFLRYERIILLAAYIAPALFKIGWLGGTLKLAVIAAPAALLLAVLRRLAARTA